ncbi:MAG: YitT family protein [Clostridia bacterium]|nr:YitT family protein [Clostridia bacterium]
MEIVRGWKKALLAAAGGGIFALAVDLFYLPAGITTGGITGIAMLLRRGFGLPVGAVSLGLNVPLFALAFRFLGGRFAVRSLCGAGISYIACDALAFLEKSSAAAVLRSDPLLAALFGGMLMGGGLGLVFAAGATTGGIDIAAALVRRKRPGLSMGRLMLAGDLCIIAAGAAADGDIRGFMYGCVALYISSRAIDALLYGLDRGSAALVVTGRPEAVKAEIFRRLSRGVTELSAVGGYTGEGRTVLLCAVSLSQTAELTCAVRESDPGAFVILTEAREMVGRGFGDKK